MEQEELKSKSICVWSEDKFEVRLQWANDKRAAKMQWTNAINRSYKEQDNYFEWDSGIAQQGALWVVAFSGMSWSKEGKHINSL